MSCLLTHPKEQPGGWYIAQEEADAQLTDVGPMDAGALDALRQIDIPEHRLSTPGSLAWLQLQLVEVSAYLHHGPPTPDTCLIERTPRDSLETAVFRRVAGISTAQEPF